MLVEIFWISGNLESSENIINNWLIEKEKSNTNFKIKHILQSADGSNDDTSAVVSIWYEENND